MNAYYAMYLLDKARGNYQSSLDFHEKYLTQKENILGIQKATEIAGLQFQATIDQQEIENTKLKQINTLKEAQIKQRDLIMYISFAGIVLLLALAYVLYQANQNRLKANLQLSEKNEEINLQNEEISAQRDNLDQTLKELKSTQSQLVQSEKMASLGQLTAGIAHEINNPINYVYAGIDSLKLNIDDLKDILGKAEDLIPEEKIAELDDYKEDLEFEDILIDLDEISQSIKNGASRTKEIVAGLRTFSRLDEDAYKEINIHENLDSTLLLLKSQIGENISIEKQYEDIPKFKGYPGPLNQVFMNILSNAIQAIDGDGSVSISTRYLPTDSLLLIAIKDTGKGMSQAIMGRVFEPFFTTKDVGKGTGLGLSIAHSIIQKHKGKIEVESEEGKGSEFRIILPLG